MTWSMDRTSAALAKVNRSFHHFLGGVFMTAFGFVAFFSTPIIFASNFSVSISEVLDL